MRLCGKRERIHGSDYEWLRDCIEQRLTQLLNWNWENVGAKRLVKQLRRHRNELLNFLYHKYTPYNNNHAERIIRGGT
jgi:hypothetical protein